MPVGIHTHCIRPHMWKYYKCQNMQTSPCLLEYQRYWFARQSINKLSITLINMVVAQSLAVHFSIPFSLTSTHLIFLFLCTCPDTCTTPYNLSSQTFLSSFFFFFHSLFVIPPDCQTYLRVS